MTHEQLIRVAIRRGVVQWERSGLVEQVGLRTWLDGRLERMGVVVVARALLGRSGGPGRWRPLYPRMRDGAEREFWCREVGLGEYVELGQMLERG